MLPVMEIAGRDVKDGRESIYLIENTCIRLLIFVYFQGATVVFR